ncbi:unnamed protein product [Lactuca virosa]|uniref:Reverse transcriptase zinc-binding domain-containing protein n=1 Tax=Lactuca virosa TaxID=75947 RepID=A0AAU9LVT5_9ASTR|nr:unnamed protein product [Lactuca virosa]
MVKYGRIPTATELSKRGVNLETLTCRMCEEKDECPDHALVDCSFAKKKVADGIWRWCNVQVGGFNKVNDLLDFVATWGSCAKRRKIIVVICYGMLWCIWKARNERVFKKNRLPPDKVIEIVKSVTFLWVMNRGKMAELAWKNWSQCPFF